MGNKIKYLQKLFLTIEMNFHKSKFMLIIISIIAIIVYAINLKGTKQSSHLSQINLICIGDSITQGGKGNRPEYTYRLPLYRKLISNNINVDFIGTRQSGLDRDFNWPSDFDLDHEGFYGATTQYVSTILKKNLRALPSPDYAVIHLGTNDQGKDDPNLTVIAPMRTIIELLRKKNSNVKIVIIQIPGFYKNALKNYEIWRLASSLTSEKSPITTIPLFLSWDNEKYTFDGVHPNKLGQEKIAEAVFKELLETF